MTTDDILCAGKITASELASLLTSCTFDKETRVLAEQLPARVITEKERQNLFLFEDLDILIKQFEASSVAIGKQAAYQYIVQYSSGRIFNEHGELRWQHSGQSLQAVYTGSHEHSLVTLLKDHPGFACKNIAQHPHHNICRAKRSIYLFGSRIIPPLRNEIRVPDDLLDHYDIFAEARIKRILHYPLNITLQDDPPKDRTQTTPIQKNYACLLIYEYKDKDTEEVLAFRFRGLQAENQKVRGSNS